MLPDRLLAALSDRYRIERELGVGGMATMYLAEDMKRDRGFSFERRRAVTSLACGQMTR